MFFFSLKNPRNHISTFQPFNVHLFSWHLVPIVWHSRSPRWQVWKMTCLLCFTKPTTLVHTAAGSFQPVDRQTINITLLATCHVHTFWHATRFVIARKAVTHATFVSQSISVCLTFNVQFNQFFKYDKSIFASAQLVWKSKSKPHTFSQCDLQFAIDAWCMCVCVFFSSVLDYFCARFLLHLIDAFIILCALRMEPIKGGKNTDNMCLPQYRTIFIYFFVCFFNTCAKTHTQIGTLFMIECNKCAECTRWREKIVKQVCNA